MYLIVGLGNPEEDYANTRHNMGFWAINRLAQKYEIDVTRSNFKGLYGTGIIENEKVLLLKPQTFMNSSGESVIEAKKFYKLTNEQIIIIYDDIDINPGEIRIRKSGGPGTHNGMKSIVHCLCADDFARIRIGIGQPLEGEDLIEHVIGAIPEEELNSLQEGVNLAVSAITEIIKNGINSAMNKFN